MITNESKTRFKKNPYSIYRKINEKPFVLNYKTGNVILLNDLGVRVWENLPKDLSKILEVIAAEYDVSWAEVQDDIAEFLCSLEQENLVVKEQDRENALPVSLPGGITHIEKIRELGIQECVPTVAKIELGYDCNLKCVHCSNITERWRKGAMAAGAFKKVIDQLYDIGTMQVSFTGGEIFLRRDLWDIIEYAHSKNFIIELLTNAVSITSQDVERLKKIEVANVQISVYSHDPVLHDSVTRVRGSFKKTVDALGLLKANKIETSVVTPLMTINFRDYQKIRELTEEIGVRHFYQFFIFERYDGSNDVYNLRLSKKEISKFFSENPAEIPYKERDMNQPVCFAGVNQCSISPFGDVYPCFHNMLPVKSGNLGKQSLTEIWKNSQALKDLRNLRMHHLELCSGCPVVGNCQICPGLNKKANDDLLQPAQVCCDYAFSAKEIVEKNSIPLKVKEANRQGFSVNQM